MTCTSTAPWVHRDHKRDITGKRITRYSACLRDTAVEQWTDADRTVTGAVPASQRATDPATSPGYARYPLKARSARLTAIPEAAPHPMDAATAESTPNVAPLVNDVGAPATAGLV